MKIASFQSPKAFSLNTNKTLSSNNQQNNENRKSYQLLGSNFAPSFKALIVKYDKNSALALDDKDKEEIKRGINDIILTSREKHRNETLLGLFDKYKNNESAMRYILVEGCENYGRYKICASDFMRIYLDNIETYFNDNKTLKEGYIKQTLLAKNDSDRTLLETFMSTPKETDNAIHCAFNYTEEFPELQAQILTKKEEGTNRSLIDMYKETGAELDIEFQKRLFKIATRMDILDREKSIELLEAAKSAIDKDDDKDLIKQALEALKSKDCYCSNDYFGKNPSKSFATINSEKMKELDKISDEIFQQGDEFELDTPFSLTPVQMAYLCLRKRKSYTDSTVRTTAISDYITKHTTKEKLAQFYTIEDNLGKLPASAYIKDKNQLEKMNGMLAKFDVKTLYDIYMHKDKQGKTLADYVLETPKMDESVVDEINNGLIDICNANYKIGQEKLKELFDTYEVLFNPMMERVQNNILSDNKEELGVIA